MRIWDLPPNVLCRNHLLGEHRELHALWNILTQNKTGYRNHPETKRWIGKQKALYQRHVALVVEMGKRKYNHQSELNAGFATGKSQQDQYIDTPEKQKIILQKKGCSCRV